MSTWTTPATFSAAAVLTAAQLNATRDNLNWLKGALTQLNVNSDTAKASITPALVGCRVYKAADQTITTGIQTAVNCDSERFDSDAFHDTVTNNTRITIPTSFGGYYLIGGGVSWAANATGYRYVGVRVNGTDIIDLDRNPAGNSGTQTTELEVCTLYQFAAADYAEMIVAQNSGGNLNVSASTFYSPEFWTHRLSST
jgi:hypothetical protein